MRFFGIDVGSQSHVVAMVDEDLHILLKPTSFGEDAAGYDKLRKLLGELSDCLVVMEATGHYSRNLQRTLASWGFEFSVVNPLRTRRFAEEDLARAKTDSIDALGIARFAALKRPAPTAPFDDLAEQLRELVRLRLRFVQDLGDRQRQLHRLLDLCFPEFTRHVRSLDTDLARGILREFPTAQAIGDCTVRRLARLRCGRRTVGTALARELVQAAKASIARHQGEVYSRQIRFLCEDAVVLATRIRELESEIETKARQHEVAALLSTIDGLGILTAAHVVAEVADPAAFRSAAALAAYVGVVPGTKQSGRWQPRQARLSMIGNARLRRALWMPTLAAVRCNPWLAAHYQRLRERGKPPKVALIAAMRKLLTAVYSVAKNRKPFAHHPDSKS
jgi:transposase